MRKLPLVTAGAVALATLTAVGATTQTAHAAPADFAFALSGTNLLRFDVADPTAATPTAITGVTAGETLVGIDFRPQNGGLYALGVNATADNATLYVVQEQNGVAAAVGSAGGVAMTNGVNPIDLPDPATSGYGFDVNPQSDRGRVTAGSLSFRVNLNTGVAVDGDNTGLTSGNVSGTNPDGPVSGGTTSVQAAAYTNNVPNNGNITTLYTLDASSDNLYRQTAANTGNQALVAGVTVGGSSLDFNSANGFDIASGVNAPASNIAVPSGVGYAALNVGGITMLYTINLVSGAATVLGTIGNGTLAVQGLALQRDIDEGYPVVGLNAAGDTLVRFSTATPGTTTSQALNLAGLGAGENRLAAIAWRPQTGKLIGLGVNHTGDAASLYVVDPQAGTLTAIGATGSLAWVESDGVTPVDLPNPTVRPYAMDVNPQVDRVRITSGADLNARANPVLGLPVDGGDVGVAGTNPDGPTGRALSAVAYTNGYGGALATTLFALSAVPDELVTVNPPNSGVLTAARPITLGGQPLDLAPLAGLDIPEDVPGTAYAALSVGGQPGLYSIALATGVATSRGSLPTALRSIALGQAGADRPVPAPPAVSPAKLTKAAAAKQRKKTVDTGRVLACPKTFTTPTCNTRVSVIARFPVRIKGKSMIRLEAFPAKTLATPRGTSTRLKFALSKRCLKLLKKKGTLVIRVTMTAPTGPKAALRTTTVKVKLSKKKL